MALLKVAICSDRSSLPSSLLLFSCSCVACFVLCCAVLCCVVCAVIPAKIPLKIVGVEQLSQARRMIGGIGNMLFSTYSQT